MSAKHTAGIHEGKQSNLLALVSGLTVLLLVVSVLLGWLDAICEYPQYNAQRGFSPIHWVNSMRDPGNFTRDFPGGIQIFKNCLTMWAYPLLHKFFSIPPEVSVQWIILLEYVALAFAFALFYRTLFPTSSVFPVVFLLLLLEFSQVRNINLARFYFPYFRGLYYNFEDVARIFSIVFLLQKKPIRCAVCAGVAFAIHPTEALMLVVFLAAAGIPYLREFSPGQLFKATIVFGMLSGLWMLATVDMHSITNQKIPDAIWLDLAYQFNAHWFPGRFETFTRGFLGRLFPLLTLILMGGYYLFRDCRDRKALSLLLGCGAMVILSVVGVWFAEDRSSPFMIKLALHRSTELIVIVFLMYYVHGLWCDLRSGSVVKSSIAASLLLLPFVSETAGYSFLLSSVLLLPLYKFNWRVGDWAGFGFLLVALHISMLLLLFAYALQGWVHAWDIPQLTGGAAIRPYMIAFVVLSIVSLLTVKRPANNVLHCSSGVVVFVLTFFLINSRHLSFLENENQCSGGTFMEAQLWARENTAPDALFLYDPTKYYGWRDYSRRSSFGNIREWLHIGWLYDSDPNVFREGVRRAGIFGFDFERYYGKNAEKSFSKKIFYAEVRNIFYNNSSAQWKSISQDFGIDYLVMIRDRMKDPLSDIPRGFENQDYVILDMTRWSRLDNVDRQQDG